MAKRCTIALCLLLALPFGGAGAEMDALRVTVTVYPLYLAVSNITQGVPVRVSCLAPPESGCMHDYQLTAKDRRLLEQSDAIVINGAGLEDFLTRVLPQLPGAVIDASGGVRLLRDPGGEANPHVWAGIHSYMEQVGNIVDGLSALDPTHEALYRQNGGAYLESLRALEAELAERLAPLSGARIVTAHAAFDYFAEAFGLVVAATVETEPGHAPSARELARILQVIQTEEIRALFAEVGQENQSLDILSRESGIPVYALDPAVSGTGSLSDYARIMRANATTLLEALQ